MIKSAKQTKLHFISACKAPEKH